MYVQQGHIRNVSLSINHLSQKKIPLNDENQEMFSHLTLFKVFFLISKDVFIVIKCQD